MITIMSVRLEHSRQVLNISSGTRMLGQAKQGLGEGCFECVLSDVRVWAFIKALNFMVERKRSPKALDQPERKRA